MLNKGTSLVWRRLYQGLNPGPPALKRALYHRRSRRVTFCLGYLIKDIALCLERNQNLIAIKTIYVCFLWRLVTILKNSLGMPWSNLRYINWSNVTFKFISMFLYYFFICLAATPSTLIMDMVPQQPMMTMVRRFIWIMLCFIFCSIYNIWKLCAINNICKLCAINNICKHNDIFQNKDLYKK